MSKFNYVGILEVPSNVMDFFLTTSDWYGESNPLHAPPSVNLINEFLNELDVWYTEQNMKIEDFYNG